MMWLMKCPLLQEEERVAQDLLRVNLHANTRAQNKYMNDVHVEMLLGYLIKDHLAPIKTKTKYTK